MDTPKLDQTTQVQQLFVQHLQALKYFILSILPNPSEAEDIVQEVFLVITAKANEFETGTNFKAWAMTIARFKVLEHLRRERRENQRFSDDVIQLMIDEMREETTDPDQEAALSGALARCLEKLSPKSRRMIEMQYRERKKPAAIAEAIGWEAPAVYVALSRARKALRVCIEKQPTVKGLA